jgi:hypothetical protein
MRTFLNIIKKIPHAEEQPGTTGAPLEARTDGHPQPATNFASFKIGIAVK